MKGKIWPWWFGGTVLGLIQAIAVAARKPLGASTQFVVLDTQILQLIAPGYVGTHPLISASKYTTPGYGWWLDIGLIVGAVLAALLTGRWRLRKTCLWAEANGFGVGKRFLLCFIGGFLILLGARFAHGCTSGQFASGWAQLSVSVIPFTIFMFGAGMLTARLVYPKTPQSRTDRKGEAS